MLNLRSFCKVMAKKFKEFLYHFCKVRYWGWVLVQPPPCNVRTCCTSSESFFNERKQVQSQIYIEYTNLVDCEKLLHGTLMTTVYQMCFLAKNQNHSSRFELVWSCSDFEKLPNDKLGRTILDRLCLSTLKLSII